MGHRFSENFGTYRKLHLTIRNSLSLTVAFGAVGYITLSNGVFVDRVRKWYQLYEKNGTPKSMDPRLAELCISALQETRIPNKKKLKSKFFYVNGTEMFSAGSYEFRFGAIFGVPFNFTFNSLEEVNKELIRSPTGQIIDWESDAGQQLLHSMILSEDEKKFALAKEMHFVNNYRIVFLSLGALFCTFIPGFINEYYTKGHSKAVPLRTVLLIYAITIPLALVKYLMFDEVLTGYYSSKADTLAASLNDQYRKGAIEYYKKKLMANQAWRKLLGTKGTLLYSESGDENSWRITKNLSQKLKKLESVAQSDAESIDKLTSEKMIQ